MRARRSLRGRIKGDLATSPVFPRHRRRRRIGRCRRIVVIVAMPIPPGAAARLRHYMRPGPASAAYPAKADGFLHGVANQLHYLQRPGLVGLVPSNRVMDCLGMVRKALFDEMTAAGQLAVKNAVTELGKPSAFDSVCKFEVVYGTTIRARVDYAGVCVRPPPRSEHLDRPVQRTEHDRRAAAQ